MSNQRKPNLDQVLAYENGDILFRFSKKYAVSTGEAREIFRETLKWLWLAARPDRPRRWVISPRLYILDEMWHNFILFTREYQDYCKRTFGQVLHHEPTTRREWTRRRQLLRRDSRSAIAQARRVLVPQIRFIAERLGIETVKRWFFEYPAKYGEMPQDEGRVRPVPPIAP